MIGLVPKTKEQKLKGLIKFKFTTLDDLRTKKAPDSASIKKDKINRRDILSLKTAVKKWHREAADEFELRESERQAAATFHYTDPDPPIQLVMGPRLIPFHQALREVLGEGEFPANDITKALLVLDVVARSDKEALKQLDLLPVNKPVCVYSAIMTAGCVMMAYMAGWFTRGPYLEAVWAFFNMNRDDDVLQKSATAEYKNFVGMRTLWDVCTDAVLLAAQTPPAFPPDTLTIDQAALQPAKKDDDGNLVRHPPAHYKIVPGECGALLALFVPFAGRSAALQLKIDHLAKDLVSTDELGFASVLSFDVSTVDKLRGALAMAAPIIMFVPGYDTFPPEQQLIVRLVWAQGIAGALKDLCCGTDPTGKFDPKHLTMYV